MNYLKRHNKDYFYRYKKLFCGAVIFGLLADLLMLIDFFALKIIFDDGFLGGNYTIIYIIVIVAILFKLISSVFGILRGYCMSKISNGLYKIMLDDYFKHLQGMDLAFFKNIQLGQVTRVVMEDALFLSGNIAHCYPVVIRCFFQMVMYLLILFYVNVELTLISLMILPLFMISKKYFEKKILPAMKQSRYEAGELTPFYQEHLSGIRLVMESCAENIILKRLKIRLKKINDLNITYSLNVNFNSVVSIFFTFLGPMIVLLYGGFQMVKGEMTMGEIIGFYYLVAKLYSPFEGFIFRLVRIKEAEIWAERFYRYLDLKPQIVDHSSAVSIKSVNGDVSFENIDVNFENSRQVLNKLNLTIKAGQTIGLVGKSGSGKSTISNLLYRFIEPQVGYVKIDGVDIQNYTIQSLRSQLGIVSQDTILFHTTIKANLEMAGENITQEMIEEATKSARIHDFILSLPQKYDTIVGEKGVKLSGGEKQRLALARTLLRNPKILILDEASSHLDNQNEKEIFDDLLACKNGRTTIIIAHRLTTVKDCDQIFVLSEGNITESGTFGELLDQKGLFNELWQHDIRSENQSAEVNPL